MTHHPSLEESAEDVDGYFEALLQRILRPMRDDVRTSVADLSEQLELVATEVGRLKSTVFDLSDSVPTKHTVAEMADVLGSQTESVGALVNEAREATANAIRATEQSIGESLVSVRSDLDATRAIVELSSARVSSRLDGLESRSERSLTRLDEVSSKVTTEASGLRGGLHEVGSTAKWLSDTVADHGRVLQSLARRLSLVLGLACASIALSIAVLAMVLVR